MHKCVHRFPAHGFTCTGVCVCVPKCRCVWVYIHRCVQLYTCVYVHAGVRGHTRCLHVHAGIGRAHHPALGPVPGPPRQRQRGHGEVVQVLAVADLRLLDQGVQLLLGDVLHPLPVSRGLGSQSRPGVSPSPRAAAMTRPGPGRTRGSRGPAQPLHGAGRTLSLASPAGPHHPDPQRQAGPDPRPIDSSSASLSRRTLPSDRPAPTGRPPIPAGSAPGPAGRKSVSTAPSRPPAHPPAQHLGAWDPASRLRRWGGGDRRPGPQGAGPGRLHVPSLPGSPQGTLMNSDPQGRAWAVGCWVLWAQVGRDARLTSQHRAHRRLGPHGLAGRRRHRAP